MQPGNRFRTFALTAAVLTGAAVAGVSTVTVAALSDTAPASITEVGAASVVLGRADSAPEFSFVGLRPGARSLPVVLTVTYQGTVPADLALRLAPGPASPLCVERAGRKASGIAGGVLLTVGNGRPRGYCELLGGAPLPLVSAMAPNTTVTVDVTAQLRAHSAPSFGGLVQNDLATVVATGIGGGFSDEVTGRLDLATADLGGGPGTARSSRSAADPLSPASEVAPGVLATRTPDGPVTITDPVAAPVELPEECARSGMRADRFVAQIRLEPGATGVDPGALFGDGVGPFLVIGTGGDDTIVGGDVGDCIVGGGGKDRVSGGDGPDVLLGGVGDDDLRGGAGDDLLLGGLGADRLHGDAGDDLLDGGADGATACDGAGDVRVAVGCPAVDGGAQAPSTEGLRTDPAPGPGGGVAASDEPPSPTTSPPAGGPSSGATETERPEPETGAGAGSQTSGAAESSSSAVPTAVVSEPADPQPDHTGSATTTDPAAP